MCSDITADATNMDLFFVLMDLFFSNDTEVIVLKMHETLFKKRKLLKRIRETHIRQHVNYNIWLNTYNETHFFELFRMQNATFYKLLHIIILNDQTRLIQKRYRGGNHVIPPEKGLLAFLWYMSKQDTLLSIADRFNLVPSTVMHLVNAFLYVLLQLKGKYIFWPKTQDEYQVICNGFTNYPNVDGTHIKMKVPANQHDSYVNRYQSHSINCMGICTANKIFTYVFVGYPGSVHDSRVFSNSSLVQHIEQFGKHKYFPMEEYHLIGDSAFPLRSWLITPYSRRNNLIRREKHHNFCLSGDRVCIENTFGILKGRWARLQYINTYSVSKAIEISTVACVLHNFCYLNNDEWQYDIYGDMLNEEEYVNNNREEFRLGNEKRNNIAMNLAN
jgi:hypothetical protein